MEKIRMWHSHYFQMRRRQNTVLNTVKLNSRCKQLKSTVFNALMALNFGCVDQSFIINVNLWLYI